MKSYIDGRVQFEMYDDETDKVKRITLRDLKEDAPADELVSLGEALNPLVELDIDGALITENYKVII